MRDQVLLLSDDERETLINYITERRPGYSVLRWCGACVAKMLELAYAIYQNENNGTNSNGGA